MNDENNKIDARPYIEKVRQETKIGDRIRMSDKKGILDKETKVEVVGTVVDKTHYFAVLDLGMYKECFTWWDIWRDGRR